MNFYNAETKCRKCAHIGTIDRWEKFDLPTFKIKEEHIKRECANCGYIWYERVLNIKEGYSD